MGALDITYLLTPKVWGEYGFTDINTDTKKLLPIIRDVQARIVESVIGKNLYDKFIEDIDAGTPIVGLYKECLDKYILPMMIAYCDYKATWHTTYQITNKTTGRNRDEHIEPNDVNQNNDLRNELIKTAKSYEKKLKNWLCDNTQKIEELRIEGCSGSDLSQSNDYFNSIGIF